MLRFFGIFDKKRIDTHQENGQQVEVLDDFTDAMGHAGAIKIDPDSNIKYGRAVPRGDGAALGFLFSGMKNKIHRWLWRIVFHERYEEQNPAMALENCLSCAV
ncbi:hypothetical protein KW850_04190 [Bacillus sp. sid0103]|uniref:hypothetical protein n=1 Tax=Bacillus sp. sid0103 TaxID=2856337 RepID=UPI001C483428|nr:hypothetical protein [Bacillus sp. sid0103]MBV7504465.1 hypothetical protein [Bacillus sp. sid0103]